MRILLLSTCVAVLLPVITQAQSAGALGADTISASHQKPSWFSRRDLAGVGIGAIGVGVLSTADESLAKAFQRQSLQNNISLNHSLDFVQFAGDPGALALSASLYVVGLAAHRPSIKDAGWHATESIVVTGAITQLLKLATGRARPNITHGDNAYLFRPGHDFTKDFNSFPSGHVSASFAAATALSNELKRHHPTAARVVNPALYGVASAVGAARMYNNRHWFSDVVAGALIGHVVANRITSRAH